MYAVSYSMKFSPKKLARLILDSGMQKGELADVETGNFGTAKAHPGAGAESEAMEGP